MQSEGENIVRHRCNSIGISHQSRKSRPDPATGAGEKGDKTARLVILVKLMGAVAYTLIDVFHQQGVRFLIAVGEKHQRRLEEKQDRVIAMLRKVYPKNTGFSF